VYSTALTRFNSASSAEAKMHQSSGHTARDDVSRLLGRDYVTEWLRRRENLRSGEIVLLLWEQRRTVTWTGLVCWSWIVCTVPVFDRSSFIRFWPTPTCSNVKKAPIMAMTNVLTSYLCVSRCRSWAVFSLYSSNSKVTLRWSKVGREDGASEDGAKPLFTI